MTKIFDDIYYYIHPVGANCNVYAFTDGNNIDLIDTGIKKLGIVNWLIRSMKKDGLNPANIRKIVHPHYHFDHTQADTYFQEKIIKNGKNTPVYIPTNDLFRSDKEFNLLSWNFNELLERFGESQFSRCFRNYRRAFRLGGIMFPKLVDVKTPYTIQELKDGQKIELGKRQAKVFSTGGHTEGHSFLHFYDEDNILYTGDHNALNEFTCDWGKTLESVRLAQRLNPDNVFIGHNAVKLGTERAQDWINSYFTQFEHIFAPIISNFKLNQTINLSNIISKMMGWVVKIKGLYLWANMAVYAIGKHLEELGLGTLHLHNLKNNPEQFCFEFQITKDPEEVDLINLIKFGKIT